MVGASDANEPPKIEVIDDMLVGSVPFPSNAAEVVFDLPDQQLTASPFGDLLRLAIQRLPDDAFAHPRQQRRKALLNKVEAVETQVDRDAYRGAANKLSNDIAKHISDWIRDGYQPTGAAPGKDDLLDLVADLVERMDELATADNHGNGNNNGNARRNS